MVATNLNPEIQLSNGSWLKNPVVRDGKRINDPKAKTMKVSFNLCVDVDHDGETVQRVIETFNLSFTRYEEEAIILDSEGQPVNLLEFLGAGNTFVPEDVQDAGHPMHDELGEWFTYGFGHLEFAESPLTWYAKWWGLQKIQFDGRTMEELGFQWQ